MEKGNVQYYVIVAAHMIRSVHTNVVRYYASHTHVHIYIVHAMS